MSKWISTKDRMPPRDTPVLFWYDDRAMRGENASPRYMIGRRILDWLRPDGWNGDHGEEITHWMPLPPPPR